MSGTVRFRVNSILWGLFLPLSAGRGRAGL